MGRYLTGDDEEILRSFRPHPVSWLASYAAGLAWLAWGAAGWAVANWLPVAWSTQAGWATFAVLVVLHGLLRARWTRSRRALVIHGVGLAIVAGAWAASQAGLLLPGSISVFDPILAGALLAVASLAFREAERLVTQTYVTTQRIVWRQGLSRRKESVLLYADIERVDTEQRLLGTMFGFGRLHLVKRTRRRGRRTPKQGSEQAEDEAVVVLKGVPRFEEARRDVNTLVNEVRLSEKERHKRIEERRLKQSMAQLSHWRPPRAP